MSIYYLRLDSFQDGNVKNGFNGVLFAFPHIPLYDDGVCIKSFTLWKTFMNDTQMSRAKDS